MIDADDFPRDPYGWVTNQAAHFAIGLAMVAFGVPLLLVAPIYWVVSEVALQRLALWQDGLVDTFHVAMGAAVLTADDPRPWLIVWGATLAAGVWRRRR